MRVLSAILVCIFFVANVSSAQQRSASEVIAQNGMAATSHPLASQIALDILKQGGSAIDAAIAANAALGFLEPMSCGIGGDLFAIVWDAKTEKLYGLNASGRSPQSLKIDHFREKEFDQIPVRGPLALSVPGCVDGWYSLHEKFGVLPMQQILQPVIKYAKKGAPVPEIIAGYFAGGVKNHADSPNFVDTFGIDGVAPVKGQVFNNPNLARTYEKISGDRDAFYKGDIAETIAEFVKKQGGFLSYADLASHQSEWVQPYSVNYRGYDVWQLPPSTLR